MLHKTRPNAWSGKSSWEVPPAGPESQHRGPEIPARSDSSPRVGPLQPPEPEIQTPRSSSPHDVNSPGTTCFGACGPDGPLEAPDPAKGGVFHPQRPVRTKNIRFGAVDVTKPYKIVGFVALDVTKPFKLIWFGTGPTI